MKLIRKYRVPLIVGMIVALWCYVGAVWCFDVDTANIVRIAVIPYLVAGAVALATFFAE